MTQFPTIVYSESKEDLIKQYISVNDFLYKFYKETPLEYFNSKGFPEGWSIKRNLKHVISSNYSFGLWIGAPSFFLNLFGKIKKSHHSIEKINPTNRNGITDYGRYLKSENNSQKEKDKLLKQLNESCDHICRKIEKRTENELDEFRGFFLNINLKMFCLFVLKHNLHHSNVVNLRLKSTLE